MSAEQRAAILARLTGQAALHLVAAFSQEQLAGVLGLLSTAQRSVLVSQLSTAVCGSYFDLPPGVLGALREALSAEEWRGLLAHTVPELQARLLELPREAVLCVLRQLSSADAARLLRGVPPATAFGVFQLPRPEFDAFRAALLSHGASGDGSCSSEPWLALLQQTNAALSEQLFCLPHEAVLFALKQQQEQKPLHLSQLVASLQPAAVASLFTAPHSALAALLALRPEEARRALARAALPTLKGLFLSAPAEHLLTLVGQLSEANKAAVACFAKLESFRHMLRQPPKNLSQLLAVLGTAGAEEFAATAVAVGLGTAAGEHAALLQQGLQPQPGEVLSHKCYYEYGLQRPLTPHAATGHGLPALLHSLPGEQRA